MKGEGVYFERWMNSFMFRGELVYLGVKVDKKLDSSMYPTKDILSRDVIEKAKRQVASTREEKILSLR